MLQNVWRVDSRKKGYTYPKPKGAVNRFAEHNEDEGRKREARNEYFKSRNQHSASWAEWSPNHLRTYYVGMDIWDPVQIGVEPVNGWWFTPVEYRTTERATRGGGTRIDQPPFAPGPVVGGPELRCYTLEWFKRNRCLLAFDSTEDPKVINSLAMKFLRGLCEDEHGVPSTGRGIATYGIDLTMPQFEVMQIVMPEMIHGRMHDNPLKTHGSYVFELSSKDTKMWSWQRMLASLKDNDLETLIGVRGGGIVGCKFMQRLGSYDHSRHTMYSEEGRPLPRNRTCPLYDFVIFSSNGNVTGLRPKYGSIEFDVHQYIHEGIAVARSCDVHNYMLAPPGASVGPGTYRYYKNIEADLKWKALSWQQIDRSQRNSAA